MASVGLSEQITSRGLKSLFERLAPIAGAVALITKAMWQKDRYTRCSVGKERDCDKVTASENTLIEVQNQYSNL